MKKLILLLLIGLTDWAALADAALEISAELMQGVERQYGADASLRIRKWQQLIEFSTGFEELEKLRMANDFFNRMHFIEDSVNWGLDDYWATPIEFLSKNGGDCEDFSIAKYFTLLEMGIPENKLRLTYVKSEQTRQPHMVLTYYAEPKTEPLVLDNLHAAIKPASQRNDLTPVYSFNGTGLWMAKFLNSGKLLETKDPLDLWRQVKSRMQTQFGRINTH